MARLKLNKEEINSIQELQQRNNDILFQLGDAEVALRNLQIRKEELMKAWDELMIDDKSFGDAITEKYGKGTIDFQKNEIVTGD
jgi:hypothetical protein